MTDAAGRIFCVFNLCEGLLWILIGIGFLVDLLRRRDHADLRITACVLFVTFGVSDFVEIWSGGWHKPWWLLAWKAADICGFVLLYALFRKRRKPS